MDKPDLGWIFRNENLTDDTDEGYSIFCELTNSDEGHTLGNSAMYAGYHLFSFFPVFWPQVRNFPLQESDVMISTFPKSGTTWMQHMVYLIVTQDFEGGDSVNLEKRVPFIEYPKPLTHKPLDDLAAKPPPRIIKTHLPAEFLPEDVHKAKVIYVYRNAKDVAVSFYYHTKAYRRGGFFYRKSFEEYVRDFLKGEICYGPYHKSLKSYYDIRSSPWLLMLRYEDIKSDARSTIRKIAAFLNKDLSDEVVEKIYEATTFDAMRKNEAVNYSILSKIGAWAEGSKFMRKGVVGDWKNHFTDPKLLADFEEYIQKNVPKEMIVDTD